MKALLDTHVVLWAIGAPHELSREVREILDDPTTEIFISSVTAWEIATKHRLGKLPAAAPLLATYAAQTTRLRATAMPLTTEHGLYAGQLVWPHKDPFDRALAAQSMIENLTLVTKDSAFATLPGVRTMW